MKKRKKAWLAVLLAALSIGSTAPASLAAETETTVQEETVAAAEKEAAETGQETAEETAETAEKAETTAETENASGEKNAASENSGVASAETAGSTTGEKAVFVLVLVLMFVAPVMLFFILLVIFTRLQNFILKKTGRLPGANMGKHHKNPEELKKNSRK